MEHSQFVFIILTIATPAVLITLIVSAVLLIAYFSWKLELDEARLDRRLVPADFNETMSISQENALWRVQEIAEEHGWKRKSHSYPKPSILYIKGDQKARVFFCHDPMMGVFIAKNYYKSSSITMNDLNDMLTGWFEV
tara:strand:- start:520 stop:933 length:414 start_codon:yes stop_codon:yes gene_type:complete